MMTDLVNQIRDNVQIPEREVIQVVNLFGQKMTTLLLIFGETKSQSLKKVVEASSWGMEMARR